MMMHLLKPDKRYRTYRGRVRIGDDLRPHYVNLKTGDKEVAWTKLQRHVAELQREREGMIAPRAARDALNKLLPDLIDEFVEDLRRKKRRKDYVRQVKNRLPVLAKACRWRTLRDITPKGLLDWRNTHDEYQPRTLNHFVDAAKAFLNWIEQTYQLENPLKRIEKLSVNARYPEGPRAFSGEELTRLLAVPTKWRLLYLFLALTGLRRGESKQLQWRDVVFGPTPFLRLREEATKSWRADTIPLNSALASELEKARPRHAKPTDRVFRDGVARNSTLKRDLERAGVALVDGLGRPIGFHTFRRSFVTLAHVLGIAPRVVQQLSRHKNADLTNFTYADTDKFDTRGAVEKLGVLINPQAEKYAAKYAHSSGNGRENLSTDGQTEKPNEDAGAAEDVEIESDRASLSSIVQHHDEIPWRRGRDSNPRYAFAYTAFPVLHNRPLCHLSGAARTPCGAGTKP